jgi:peptide/nickel transport system permease protein
MGKLLAMRTPPLASKRGTRKSAGQFRRYLVNKVVWYLIAFFAALLLNFLLIRLIPGNPVDTIVARMSAGGNTTGEAMQKMYAAYMEEFGLNQPIINQFIIYLGNLTRGDLGSSFNQYPTPVMSLVLQALPWSIALQFPAILIGWIVGNFLGALSAYKKGLLDRGVFPVALFASSMPYYCLAIILLYLFSVVWKVFPSSGGYGYDIQPELSWPFIKSALEHYTLPFLSLTLVFIGGQAIGMRAMSVYELDADYVRYSRSLGVADNSIIRYIFRNGMLPQVTGLALSIGTMVSGALITEIVFSYPGIGTLLFRSIRTEDYTVVQGITLLIMIGVLMANFLVDIAYGFIDPRIRASTAGER